MQRTIDATRRAERQVARRLARRALLENGYELSEARRGARLQAQEMKRLVLDERVRRRQDYECGPRLLPRRDIGTRTHSHGALSGRLFQTRTLPALHPSLATPTVAVGDRVVLLSGRDRGKIGQVKAVEPESMTCRVEGLNQAEMELDRMTQHATRISDAAAPYPMSMPLSDVKLVYPIRGPTGIKDCVIDRLAVRDAPSEKTLRYKPRARAVRFIPGTDTVIPWPALSEPPAEKTQPDDTARLNVDEVTDAQPVLLSAPMPTTVIDELRNKYSRFRTRHTAAHVAAKERAAARREQQQAILRRLVKTPMQEFHERRLGLAAASRPAGLSREQLAAIGEAVARERADV